MQRFIFGCHPNALCAQAIATLSWAYSELRHFDDGLFEALAVRGAELLQMRRPDPADGAIDMSSTGSTPRPRPLHGTSRAPAVPRLLDAPQVKVSA